MNDDEEIYGPQNVLDGREDTCWNSDGGAEQELLLTLAHASPVRALELVFQGGFVGQDMRVLGAAAGLGEAPGAGEAAPRISPAAAPGAGASSAPQPPNAAWVELGRFQPVDGNEPQRFALSPSAGPVQQVRLQFSNSTDFYGRVVMYAARLFA